MYFYELAEDMGLPFSNESDSNTDTHFFHFTCTVIVKLLEQTLNKQAYTLALSIVQYMTKWTVEFTDFDIY